MPIAKTVRQLAQEKWQSSGLSNLHARKLRFEALPAKRVALLGKSFLEAGALRIPYFDLIGKPTKFYRVRYLERLPGAAGIVEKPQRYAQPPALQEAYFPPLLKQSWVQIAKDPKVEVCVTEGELKAACACARGIPMFALGGVYSFMSGKRGVDLLLTLKSFDWKERVVRVVYDNDLSKNPDVLRAQNLLAQTLVAEGARVEFVGLPAGPAKGVDDYIVSFGINSFKELLQRTTPFLEGQALWEMNSDVVLIKNDGVPIVVERRREGTVMAPNVFNQVLYANRHYMKQIERGTGKNRHVVMEKEPLAPHWMEWEQRAELQKLTYEPGKPKIIRDAEWNTWNGWGVSPRKGDVRPWNDLLDFIFENDQKARKYFERWLAYPIQYPGAKLYVAAVLWSRVKRLGKSMIGIAMKYIYGENATFVNSRQLKSQFNSWAKDKQFVVGEEITAGEARVDADYMKDLITNPYFTINSKFKAEYVIPNHTNFLFLSNHPDALFLEDGDKRYFIHGVTHNSPKPREFYERLNKWLHRDGDPNRGPGPGPAALMDHLLTLNLNSFNPREHAPETTSKYEMIVAGKTDTGLWVLRLQEDPSTALRALGQKVSDSCDIFTPDQLYRAFDPEGRGRGRASVAGLGRALAAAGFRQLNGGIPVMTATGLHRLYAVRNVVRWEQATRKEVRDHYNSFFGPQIAGGVK